MEKTNQQINIDFRLITKVKNSDKNSVHYLNKQPYSAGDVPSCHIQSCFFNIAQIESFRYWTDKEFLHKNEDYKNMFVLFFYGRMQQEWQAWRCWHQVWKLMIETDNSNFSLKAKGELKQIFILPAAIAQGTESEDEYFVQGFPVDRDILQAIGSAKQIKFTISGISNKNDKKLGEDVIARNLTFTVNANDFALHTRNFLSAILPAEQGTSRQDTEAQTCQVKKITRLDEGFNMDLRSVTKACNNPENVVYYLNNNPCLVGDVPSCHIQSCFFNIALMKSFGFWTEEEELHKNEEYKNMIVLYLYGRMQDGWSVWHYMHAWDILIETDNGDFSLRSNPGALQKAFVFPAGITQGTEREEEFFVQGFPLDRDILQAIGSARQIKTTISGVSNGTYSNYVRLGEESIVHNLSFTTNADDLALQVRNLLNAILPAEQGSPWQETEAQTQQAKERIGSGEESQKNLRLLTKARNNEKNWVYYQSKQPYNAGDVPSCHIRSCFFDIALTESCGYWTSKNFLHMNEKYKNMFVLYLYGRMEQDWILKDSEGTEPATTQPSNIFIETNKGNFLLDSEWFQDVFIPPAAITQGAKMFGHDYFVRGFAIDHDILQAISSSEQIRLTISRISNEKYSNGKLIRESISNNITFTINADDFALHVRNFIGAIFPTEQAAPQQETETQKIKDIIRSGEEFNMNLSIVSKVWNNEENSVYYQNKQPYSIGAVPSCHIQSCFFDIALIESCGYWTSEKVQFRNEKYKNMPVLYLYGRMEWEWLANRYHNNCDVFIETDNGNFSLRREDEKTSEYIFMLPAAITQGAENEDECFVGGFPIDWDILQAISAARQINITVSGISIGRHSDYEIIKESIADNLTFTVNADGFALQARNILAAIRPKEQGTSRQETEA